MRGNVCVCVCVCDRVSCDMCVSVFGWTAESVTEVGKDT